MPKVLIIDDSKFQRSIIKNMLKEMKLETVEAGDGNEALLVYQKENPDCIILDLLMPGKDGFDVLADLKNEGSHIPIIVLSADIQETSRLKCEELGAFAFLNKPPKIVELKDAVKRALNSLRSS